MAITIKNQIKALRTTIEECPNFRNFNPLKQTQFDLEIHALARNVLETPMPDAKKQKRMNELKALRERIILHTPVKGLGPDITLFLNTIQPSSQWPLCPAYSKIPIPTISTYNRIGSNIAVVHCDPEALRLLPKQMLDSLGDLSGFEVELSWTAIDGRNLNNNDSPYNLCSHTWSYFHELPGEDIAEDVNMGIFPEVGVEYAHGDCAAVAFNRLSPMRVHMHPDAQGTKNKENNKQVSPNNMLYSPDNAHFKISKNSPFSIFWMVTQKDKRMCITKTLVLSDYNHPISAALIGSIRHGYNLQNHLEKLKRVENAIDQTFQPLILEFEANAETAMQTFHALPSTFQQGVYKQTWICADSPMNIHPNFGCAAFENDPSLDPKFHLNCEQRANVIREFTQTLKELLLDSQVKLFSSSQTLIKGDNVVKMLECAQQFRELEQQTQAQEIYEIFNQFSDEEKNAVYFAIWELNNCPRTHEFGTRRFLHFKGDYKEKADALQLAASRQKHHFQIPLVNNFLAENKLAEQEEQLLAIYEEPQVDIPEQEVQPPVIFEEPNALVPEEEAQSPVIFETENNLTPPSQAENVLDFCFQGISSGEFALLEQQERNNKVNSLLQSLDLSIRHNIYGYVYHHSEDPFKGGDSWGERHVADNLDILMNAILDLANC